MFEVEKDPIFTHTDRLGDTFYFVSYNGNVYSADFSGAEARFRRALVAAGRFRQGSRLAARRLATRRAVNRASKRLYVGMHPNGVEGSHKDAGRRNVVYDLATHKRLARIPPARTRCRCRYHRTTNRACSPSMAATSISTTRRWPRRCSRARSRARVKPLLQVERRNQGAMNDPVLLYAASAALACVLLLGALEKLKDMAASAAAQAYRIVPAALGGLLRLVLRVGRGAGRRLAADARLRGAPGALLALLVLALASTGVAVNLARGRRGHRLRLRRSCHAARRSRRGSVLADGGAQRAAGAMDAAGVRRRAGRSRSLQWADAASVFGLAMSAVALYFTANHLLACT